MRRLFTVTYFWYRMGVERQMNFSFSVFRVENSFTTLYIGVCAQCATCRFLSLACALSCKVFHEKKKQIQKTYVLLIQLELETRDKSSPPPFPCLWHWNKKLKFFFFVCSPIDSQMWDNGRADSRAYINRCGKSLLNRYEIHLWISSVSVQLIPNI